MSNDKKQRVMKKETVNNQNLIERNQRLIDMHLKAIKDHKQLLAKGGDKYLNPKQLRSAIQRRSNTINDLQQQIKQLKD